jgi:ankyrin repeat protein
MPDIDVNRAMKNGMTPLSIATDRGHTEIVALLKAKIKKKFYFF